MACNRYIQPKTMEELTNAMSQMTEKSVILAGGTDLIIKMRNRHMEPDCILSLCSMGQLQRIHQREQEVYIGAMATHSEVAANPLVKNYFMALSMACDHVGSKQVRNKGTVGGSLGNASVAGDMLPVICLLHGWIEILSGDGCIRRVPATEFTIGIGKTVVKPGEIIWGIVLPIESGRRSCFVKLGGRSEVTIAEISLSFSWEYKNSCFYNVEGVMGAVDTQPIFLPEAGELFNNCVPGVEEMDKLTACLSTRIREIREKRKRQPRLRIRESERVYKEGAIKGVVYDAMELMEEMK